MLPSTTDAGFDLALSGVRYKTPKLDLRTSGTNVVVAWPALPGGFGLEAGTDLGASSGWQSVTNVVSVTTNKESKVSLPASSEAKFYRLRR